MSYRSRGRRPATSNLGGWSGAGQAVTLQASGGSLCVACNSDRTRRSHVAARRSSVDCREVVRKMRPWMIAYRPCRPTGIARCAPYCPGCARDCTRTIISGCLSERPCGSNDGGIEMGRTEVSARWHGAIGTVPTSAALKCASPAVRRRTAGDARDAVYGSGVRAASGTNPAAAPAPSRRAVSIRASRSLPTAPPVRSHRPRSCNTRASAHCRSCRSASR